MLKKLAPILIFILIAIPMLTFAQDLTIEKTPLQNSECSGAFIEHTLDHITMPQVFPIKMFDSNGSGIALNDLNQDGWIDIVLANLGDNSSILWNDGDLVFHRDELLMSSHARAVNIVDIDGDDWLDIIFTHQTSAPSLWRNDHSEGFVRELLPGVTELAYTLTWGDADQDGDLDLVTASYDAELELLLRNQFMNSDGAGVFYYENQDGVFIPTRLAERSQALAIVMDDINGDNQIDILVGNDFSVEDMSWTYVNGEWVPIALFDTMTHSTMSFDMGDIDNNGRLELFATDMHPYSDSQEVMQAWQPLMEQMMAIPMLPDDPQVMENVLQAADTNGYANTASAAQIASTGWSWSSKFGDLDSDGLLDLYVVNGMIAMDIFQHMPNGELVEENQVFRNTGNLQFEVMPEWKLNSTVSGRGMSMADMDNDGDLDIVINNLNSPAMLFENQVCGGNSITIDLHDNDTANTFALGSRVILHTSTESYTRLLRASSGYLSGEPTRIHFGLPENSVIESLEIQWRNGDITHIDQIEPNTHIDISYN
jgi:hypothetical protein